MLIAGSAAWYLARHQRPRVVFLIVVDTLRADRLSCYGYDGHETPHIDALAGSGVCFENALAVGSWTVPSMGAMMTSLYPTEVGLVESPRLPRTARWKERREQIEYTIPPDFVTLAEVFRDAGYHTAAFVNQPTLNSHGGFSQGFGEWFYPAVEDSVVRRDPSAPFVDADDTDQRRTWEQTQGADSALVASFSVWTDTLSTRDDVFVWIHLFSPHRPYRPPARFLAPDQRRLEGADRLSLAQKSTLYDGEVRYTDALVGDVLDRIRSRFGRYKPLVVFTSDHGEEFGEHGHEEHGHSLYRECVHVPLVMAGPGFPAGARVTTRARLIDVFPTLLERCGLEDTAPAGMEGTSLVSVVKGKGVDERDVYSEAMLYGATKRSLIQGEFRLIWDQRDDSSELFHIASDPDETRDVAKEYADVCSRMGGELRAFHGRLLGTYKNFLSARADVDSTTAAQERERTLKAMKSLGYVGD